MKHLKHHETVIIRCDDIGARCGDVGAQCGDVCVWGSDVDDRAELPRYRCGVSGDIGDCRVGITPQMCNRVTNHGDMSTFSKPASSDNINCHCIQSTINKYANNIECVRDGQLIYYYSQFYMATFQISCLHNPKTLTHIYLISVSINRMLISQLKRFLYLKFMFPSQFNV